MVRDISIHALFAEGDDDPQDMITWKDLFLSTPSSQRATISFRCASDAMSYFYPRPLRRGRPRDDLRRTVHGQISIHALFAEGDRDATAGRYARGISIHALFAEGALVGLVVNRWLG